MEETKIYEAACLLQQQFGALFTINIEAQTITSDVCRWSRFWPKDWKPPKTYLDPKLDFRPQSVTEHSLGMTVLGTLMGVRLEKYLPIGCRFDHHLLTISFAIHDWGEGIKKVDHPFGTKTDLNDLEEYYSFVDSFSELDTETFNFFRRAFLLQFVHPLKRANYEQSQPPNWNVFPQGIRDDLESLLFTHKQEALRFAVAERLEYVLYAIEQCVKFRNYYMLCDVLGNQFDDMELATEIVPGFGKEIWTPEISRVAQSIIS
ncbi:MAG TPA: hypothetical protein PKI61_00085 [bacterium]|nr:hypothetical protein [bacterium]HPT29448.1 hypothetical protein [bacterium]